MVCHFYKWIIVRYTLEKESIPYLRLIFYVKIFPCNILIIHQCNVCAQFTYNLQHPGKADFLKFFIKFYLGGTRYRTMGVFRRNHSNREKNTLNHFHISLIANFHLFSFSSTTKFPLVLQLEENVFHSKMHFWGCEYPSSRISH